MSIRIEGGGFPVGEISRRSAARPARAQGTFQQSFDQIQLSSQPTGQAGQVRALTAQLSQQIRTRPTQGELASLRRDILSGAYRIDSGRIASGILLRGRER